MKELKLIRILKTFKHKELKDFEKFILSPYFNKGRNLLPYFKELKKFSPHFDSSNLTKEYIFGRLNKIGKFDMKANALMNKLNSEMQKLLEAYLITKKIETSPITRGILLNEKYLEKGLHKSSLAELLKLKEQFLGPGINDTYYLPHQKMLGLTAEAYIGIGRIKEFHNTYKEFSDNVLIYMLTFYFEDYAHRIDFEIGSNVQIELSLVAKILSGLNFKEIIDGVSQKNRVQSIRLNIYYNLYLCYKKLSDYEQFNTFKSILLNNLKYFSYEEKYNLLNYLNTLCLIAERLGYESRAADMLEINEIRIKHKILSFRESEIHHTTFDNIVTLFITNKKYKAAENFIEQFSDWLPAELRERYKNMAMARLCFSKQEYNKTLEILSRLPELMLNNISAVQLRASSLFELKEYEAAEVLIESFKKYLKNNKTISKANGDRYLGFADGLQLLIKNITGNGDTEPARRMKKILERYPAAFRKTWLLNKAVELENTRKVKR